MVNTDIQRPAAGIERARGLLVRGDDDGPRKHGSDEGPYRTNRRWGLSVVLGRLKDFPRYHSREWQSYDNGQKERTIEARSIGHLTQSPPAAKALGLTRDSEFVRGPALVWHTDREFCAPFKNMTAFFVHVDLDRRLLAAIILGWAQVSSSREPALTWSEGLLGLLLVAHMRAGL